ncbi:MAG: DUF1592 domain-containing protein [Myxococcales bacterium]|nr:DUF1592 domain-containing protein [Myxococcales bacterium]
MVSRWTALHTSLLSLSLVTLGCYSGGDEDTDGGTDSAGSDSGDSGTTAGDGDGDGDSDSGDGDGDGDGDAAELPAPSTRFYRLTHAQWENSVRDLFYLADQTGFSEQFRSDPLVSGFLFDNNALALEVDQALWSGYQRAAGDVAALVTEDAGILGGFAPPDQGDPAARAQQFVEDFGLRAFRRPLTAAEVQSYLAMHGSGAALYPGVDPFAAGVRQVVDAMLQSPHFLYRVETSEAVVGQVIPLNSWEVAQRLSYFLWNSTPDDALLSAAAQDQLLDPAEVEAQAARLLADARAEQAIYDFHYQLLDVKKFASIAPSEVFFPDAPAELGAYAQEENERFIRDLIFAQEGTYADLLTASETFVNDELAAIYGVAGDFGPDFEKVALDPEERRGVFTQVGFLASNSTSVNPDPIHRGVFLVKEIVCLTVAAPPDGVPPVPPQADGKTNRQMVEEHTEVPGSVCVGCHGVFINPYGFPFEHYDAMGAYRIEDNGLPVDAATELTLGGGIAVDNALDLVEALAGEQQAHDCYLEHWIEFAHGRPEASEDGPLIERLGAASLDGATVQELIVLLVTSTPFLSRATEEL